MSALTANDEIQLALEQLENTLSSYRSTRSYQNIGHPIGSPARSGPDLSETEKAHLSVLKSKVDVVIAQRHLSALSKSSDSSDRLGKKVFWLNVVIALLTAVMAATSVLTLITGKA